MPIKTIIPAAAVLIGGSVAVAEFAPATFISPQERLVVENSDVIEVEVFHSAKPEIGRPLWIENASADIADDTHEFDETNDQAEEVPVF